MHALTHIDDQTLLSHLKATLGGERQALARFLRYLGEVDRRRLYSEAGFPSLFEFCVRGLGLREGEAFNRIRACRTAARYPEVYEWIGDGRLCLTAVRLLAPHSEAPNFLQVLGEAVGKSTRAVEKLAAGLEAERSRARLAARPEPKPQAVAVPLAFALAEAQPERREAPGPERVRYVTPETVRISFTASEPLALKIKDVRAHCRAKGVGDDFAALLDHVFEAYLEAHSPARLMRRRAERAAKRQAARARAGVATKATDAGTPAINAAAATALTFERSDVATTATASASERTDTSTSTTSFICEQPNASMVAPPSGERPGAATAAHTSQQTPAKRPRAFPRAAAAAIWQRDGGQCSFTGPGGQRCPARHGLEIDHIQPYAMGGASTVANGRLRCRAHNRLAAEQTFGKAHVSARIAAAQERRTAQTT